MSVTALAWVVLGVVLLLLSLKRPVWALALYFMTFFAAPQYWWWGRDVPSARYALWSGVLLAAVVLFNLSKPEGEDEAPRRFTIVHGAAIAMVLNATFVHVVITSIPQISIDTYTETLKYTLLFFLIWRAVGTKRDLRVALMTIAIGAGYIGYEVTINGRGDISANRLEDVGAPGANTANGLASMLLTTLPLAGGLLIGGPLREKLTVALAAPLILNVILLCNSRGTFLGMMFAGIIFLLLARGKTRKKALQALGVAAVALYLLLGDQRILDRFLTTFVGSEERDNSAQSRVEYWRAGIAMLQDFPLGAGGGSFKFVYGGRYIAEVSGREEDRSLHNGYLTEATDWGVQGLCLKLAFLGTAMVAAYRTTVRARREGRGDDSLIGIALLASAVGFLSTCMFGAYLNNEWGFWVAGLLARYSELYAVQDASQKAVPLPVVSEEIPSPVPVQVANVRRMGS